MATIRELSSVLGATARANKYRVTFTFPQAVAGATDLGDVDVLAKTAIAPQKEIGQIELWNQGRKLIIPGDTAFDNAWAVDFYLTENHGLRYDLIKWADACDNFQTNKHSGNPQAIFADLRLEQLDSDGKVTAQYTMHNCFPQTIGDVTYGDDTADTPAEFNVVFAYSDWVTGSDEESNYNLITPTRNETAL